MRWLGFFLAPMLLLYSVAVSGEPAEDTKQPALHTGDMPLGSLGLPVGSYLTIVGKRSDAGKTGTQTLSVEIVNGKRLSKPVSIWVDNTEALPKDAQCILKGFETLRMIGSPPAEIEAAKEAGQEIMLQQAGWQVQLYFVATSVVQPTGLRMVTTIKEPPPAAKSQGQTNWTPILGETVEYRKSPAPELQLIGHVQAVGMAPAGQPEKITWRNYFVVENPWIAMDDSEATRDAITRLYAGRENDARGTPVVMKGKVVPDPPTSRQKLAVGWVRELGNHDDDWRSPWPMNLELLPDDREGPILLVAACQASSAADSQLGLSGVQQARQRFTLSEIFYGDGAVGQTLQLSYSYLAPGMGFGWSGRDLRPDEKVIWVVVRDGSQQRGYGAVPDTPNNRQAAKRLAERLKAPAQATGEVGTPGLPGASKQAD